jgi:dihydrofolate synthase / folylpolyglutamate synthase
MPHDVPDALLAAALSKLDGVVDWERRDRRAGMPVSLDPVRDLLAHLGRPQDQFRTIHVAGTKGKGSVSALIEAGLQRAGIGVGRFSSPHVERITERVTFGGREIGERALATALERAWAARQDAARQGRPGGDATRFDLETVAAILAFVEAQVEWAVLECGLGGRTDSTNVVDGEVAVLTNVGLEHTAVLGATHAAIAYQKVGILKPGATLITAVLPDSEAGQVIRKQADALACPVVFCPPAGAGVTIADSNAWLAQAVLDELGRRAVVIRRPDLPAGPTAGWLLDEQTRQAAQLPGRMERFDLPGSVPVILDGAHVPFNLKAVLADLDAMPDLSGPCVVVLGLGRDKQASEMLQLLKRQSAIVICTKAAAGPPAYEPVELLSLAGSAGLSAEAIPHAGDALERAIAWARNPAWILVTGSLHVVGEIRPIIRRLAGSH